MHFLHTLTFAKNARNNNLIFRDSCIQKFHPANHYPQQTHMLKKEHISHD